MGGNFFTSTDAKIYDNYTRAMFGGIADQTDFKALSDKYEDTPNFSLAFQSGISPLKSKTGSRGETKVYDFGALRAAQYAYNSSSEHWDYYNNRVSETGRVGGENEDSTEKGISYVKGPWWWAYKKILMPYEDNGGPWSDHYSYSDPTLKEADSGRAEMVFGEEIEGTSESRPIRGPGDRCLVTSVSKNKREITLPWLVEQAASGKDKIFGAESVLLSDFWTATENANTGKMNGLQHFNQLWSYLCNTGGNGKDVTTTLSYANTTGLTWSKDNTLRAVVSEGNLVDQFPERNISFLEIVNSIAATNPAEIPSYYAQLPVDITGQQISPIASLYRSSVNSVLRIASWQISPQQINSSRSLSVPVTEQTVITNWQSVPVQTVNGTSFPLSEQTLITSWQRVPVQTINGVSLATPYTVDSWQNIPPMTIQDVAALIAGDPAAIQAIQVDSTLQVAGKEVISLPIGGAVTPLENNYVVTDPAGVVPPVAAAPGPVSSQATESPVAERQNALVEPEPIAVTDINVNYAQAGEIKVPESPTAGMPSEAEPLQYGYPQIEDGASATDIDVDDFIDLDSYIPNNFTITQPAIKTADGQISAAISAFTADINQRYADDLGKMRRSLASSRRGLSSHFDRAAAILTANNNNQINDFARQLYVEQAKINLNAAIQWEEQKLRAIMAGVENGMRLLLAKYDAVSRALFSNADANTKVSLANLDATLRTTISGAESLTRAGIAASEISSRHNIAGAENFTRVALAGAENALRVVLAVADQATKVSMSNADAYNRAALTQAENTLRAATASTENRLRYVMALQDDISKHILANTETATRVRLSNAELGLRAGQANQEVALRVALSDIEQAARVLLANQDLSSRIALSNAENRLKVALATYEHEGRRLLAQAENDIRVGLANQDAVIKVQIANQETDLRVKLANQDAALRATLANNEALVRIKLANQDILLKVRLSEQEMEMRRQQANQETDLRYDLANQDVRFKAASIGVENEMRANLASMDSSLKAELANQETDLRYDLANQDVRFKAITSDVENEMRAKLATLESALKSELANQDADLKVQLSNQEQELRRQLATQEVEFKVSAANAENDLRLKLANQDLDFRVSAANQDAGLKVELANQDVDLKTKLANQDYTLRAELAEFETELKRRLANQEYGFRIASANIENELRVSLANQDYEFKRYATNQDAKLKIAIANAEIEFKRRIANQDGQFKVDVSKADIELKRRLANLDAQLRARIANQDYDARVQLANQATELQNHLAERELEYKWSALENQRKLEEFNLKANAARMVYDVTLGWMNAYSAHTGAFAGIVTNALHGYSLQRGQDRDFWINAENQRWTAMVQRASFLEGLAGLKWKAQLQNLSVMQQTLASLGQATGTQHIPSTFDAIMTGVSTVATAASSLISLGVALA